MRGGIAAWEVDAAEINGDLYRFFALAPWENDSESFAFTIDRHKPVPVPEVEFTVPPYGSRRYTAPTPAYFGVAPQGADFLVPPDNAPQSPVNIEFVARERSRVEFTIHGRAL